MKNMKKLFALALAILMVMSLATTAFAAMEGELTGGSITINDAVSGQTYSAYQILYLESYSHTTDEDGKTTATGAYAYKANSAWAEWLATCGYVSIDEQGYVTWSDGKSAADFAKAAQAYAKQNSISADKTAIAPAAAEGETYSTVTLSDLKLGYYLVDTTLGTLCSLDTTNPNVEMYEKNEKPSVDKQVQEDSNNTWGDTNDAEIGQTVNFKTVIKAYAGAQNYVLHDKMSAGLTLDQGSIAVVGLTKDTDYTVEFNTNDDCDFEITFTQVYLDKVTGTTANPTEITVTYSAVVNSNAVIAGEGNPNETKLNYGEESETEWDKTITYVWSMKVLKYGDGKEDNTLAGAKFVLLSNDKKMVATVSNGKVTSWTDISEDTDLSAYAMTTDESGSITIEGLDADTYYLREIEAPAGYNKLADDIEVKVVAGTVTNGTMNYTPVVAKVNNQSGTELPSTGGMGTTLFYIFGGVLMVGAAVLLVTKKRMSSAD